MKLYQADLRKLDRCLLFLVAIAVCLTAFDVQAGGNAPKGFRLKNGALVKWGDSCEQAQAKAGRISYPADAIKIRREAAQLLEKSGVPNASEGEDATYAAVSCGEKIIVADAVPPPYYLAAQLFFNAKGQLYGVAAWLKTDDFADARQPLIASLGPPHEEKGVVENAFGATFDKTTDRWLVGGVSVVLQNRVNTVDKGTLTMTYQPLAPKLAEKSLSAPF